MNDVYRRKLNIVLQINLLCLLVHALLYGSTREILLSLHNPFADFVVMLAIISLIGLWLVIDFMIPASIELFQKGEKPAAKTTAFAVLLNLVALGAGASQLIDTV